MIRFLSSVCSEQGSRENNQDFAACSAAGDRFYAWGLADGLGGHAHGEAAARIAVQSILEDFTAAPAMSDSAIRDYFLAANRKVLTQQETEGYSGTRTTCAVLFSDSGLIRSANVGDTRIYFFPAGGQMRVTADHSVAYNAFLSGEIPYNEIRVHPDRNKLIRSLGNSEDLRVNLSDPVPVFAGDAFLLCSDGFWEFICEEDMCRTRSESSSPEEWLARMMEIFLKRSADYRTDNYSAVAVMAV